MLELDRQCNASTALRDFASLRSCKQLFENGFQASVGEGRAIYSNRMTGDNHDYLMALHTGTPWPHVHLTVEAEGLDGQRFDPRWEDLFKFREAFAEALRSRGV
ncbi:relaxase/mobilization nuclease domain-containing protein [Sphingobium tyrosinilyticum]|uniref:Relaxase/mobilization nuclease domain-containing protein n=1 Tax=Sphingobium tyrosinilyticum TaxID=2715436 RepID=A0ABV9F3L8_9SPHN